MNISKFAFSSLLTIGMLAGLSLPSHAAIRVVETENTEKNNFVASFKHGHGHGHKHKKIHKKIHFPKHKIKIHKHKFHRPIKHKIHKIHFPKHKIHKFKIHKRGVWKFNHFKHKGGHKPHKVNKW